jgi:hypothetical protein
MTQIDPDGEFDDGPLPPGLASLAGSFDETHVLIELPPGVRADAAHQQQHGRGSPKLLHPSSAAATTHKRTESNKSGSTGMIFEMDDVGTQTQGQPIAQQQQQTNQQGYVQPDGSDVSGKRQLETLEEGAEEENEQSLHNADEVK